MGIGFFSAVLVAWGSRVLLKKKALHKRKHSADPSVPVKKTKKKKFPRK